MDHESIMLRRITNAMHHYCHEQHNETGIGIFWKFTVKSHTCIPFDHNAGWKRSTKPKKSTIHQYVRV
jgi:hypothetical protein